MLLQFGKPGNASRISIGPRLASFTWTNRNPESKPSAFLGPTCQNPVSRVPAHVKDWPYSPYTVQYCTGTLLCAFFAFRFSVFHFAFLCSRQWLMFPFSWPLPFNVLRLILCPSAKIFLGCFRSQGLLSSFPGRHEVYITAYYNTIWWS